MVNLLIISNGAKILPPLKCTDIAQMRGFQTKMSIKSRS